MKAKQRYICCNCGHGNPIKWVRAMLDAGFSLWHLSCKKCGQQTIKEAQK